MLVESVQLLIDFHLLVVGLVLSFCVHIHVFPIVVRGFYLLFLLFLVYHNCIVCFVYFHFA